MKRSTTHSKLIATYAGLLYHLPVTGCIRLFAFIETVGGIYTPSCQKRTSPPGLCLIHNSFCFAKYLQTRYPNPIEFSKNTEDLYAIGWPLQGDPRSTVWSSDQWLSLLFALDLIRHVSVTIWWRQEDPINILSWTCGTERKCGKEIFEKVCYKLSLETDHLISVCNVSFHFTWRKKMEAIPTCQVFCLINYAKLSRNAHFIDPHTFFFYRLQLFSLVIQNLSTFHCDRSMEPMENSSQTSRGEYCF